MLGRRTTRLRRLVAVVIAGAMGMAGVGTARAASPDDVDTLSQWNGSESVQPFGDFATPTYGQVITAPGGGAPLTGFDFDVNLPSTVTFRAHVYAWNGHMATGASLFDGPPMTT